MCFFFYDFHKCAKYHQSGGNNEDVMKNVSPISTSISAAVVKKSKTPFKVQQLFKFLDKNDAVFIIDISH